MGLLDCLFALLVLVMFVVVCVFTIDFGFCVCVVTLFGCLRAFLGIYCWFDLCLLIGFTIIDLLF